MCGRYELDKPWEGLKDYYFNRGFTEEQLGRDPYWWIKPGHEVPIFTQERPGEVTMATFGFQVSWSPKLFINARAEGKVIDDDPTGRNVGRPKIQNQRMWQMPIRNKRCAIPATAFYEGSAMEKLKRPYRIFLPDRRVFLMAGLYNEVVDKQTGEVSTSFAIITTMPNTLLYNGIGHNRMPVILPKGREIKWLKQDQGLTQVLQLLHPYPDHEMDAYPVKRVNERAEPHGPEVKHAIGKTYRQVIRERMAIEESQSREAYRDLMNKKGRGHPPIEHEEDERLWWQRQKEGFEEKKDNDPPTLF